MRTCDAIGHPGGMSNRRVLVVASQCAAATPLGFLPSLAVELAEVLTDPRLGACQPAIEPGPLVTDQPRDAVYAAVKEAFRQADADGATLVLAFIGHGVAIDEDFYFLPQNGVGQGDSDEDVHLSQLLKEQLRAAANLDGLMVLLDTCDAGIGAAQAARWQEVGLGRRQRRYELLTASAAQPAYGGVFVRSFIDAVRKGVPSAGSTIDSRFLRDQLMQAAGSQHPQRITHDGGAWAEAGDEGLWWSYNAAHELSVRRVPRPPSLRPENQPLAVYRRTVTSSGRSETTEIFVFSDVGVQHLIERQVPRDADEAGGSQ